MATKQEPIQNFIFMKTLTTGRYYKEYGYPKIVELNLIAVDRRDLERGEAKKIPATLKLNVVLNPDQPVSAIDVHDLTTDFVQHSVIFKQSIGIIVAYLAALPKPICLIAHNGVSFDFKYLKKECEDACISLPEDLLYADCMWIFYHYLCEENKKIDVEVDKKKNQLSLPLLYEKLFGESRLQPRTAEQHSLMMLDCALLQKEAFLKLADKNCKLFSEVLPVGEKKGNSMKSEV